MKWYSTESMVAKKRRRRNDIIRHGFSPTSEKSDTDSDSFDNTNTEIITLQ
jgi:hypothetical protein